MTDAFALFWEQYYKRVVAIYESALAETFTEHELSIPTPLIQMIASYAPPDIHWLARAVLGYDDSKPIHFRHRIGIAHRDVLFLHIGGESRPPHHIIVKELDNLNALQICNISTSDQLKVRKSTSKYLMTKLKAYGQLSTG